VTSIPDFTNYQKPEDNKSSYCKEKKH